VLVPESLLASRAAGNDNPFAALGNRGRRIAKRIPAVPHDLCFGCLKNFAFRSRLNAMTPHAKEIARLEADLADFMALQPSFVERGVRDEPDRNSISHDRFKT
jgi:hypothetical protein